MIGARQNLSGGSGSGSAYVFQRDPNGTPLDPNDDFWVEQAKLLPSDGAEGDGFGYSVDISGDTIVIGAGHGEGKVADSGCAYIFHFDGANWLEQAKLLASDGEFGAIFGRSVAVSGYTALVGQVSYGASSPSSSVYVFAAQCGDLDTDGDVDIVDFAVFAKYWLETNCGICRGVDLVCDGTVDVNDLQAFTKNWLAGVFN